MALLLLLASHLVMNRMGVRAVQMRSLNRQRATLVFSNLLENDNVLNPQEVSEKELIFEQRGGSVIREKSGAVVGHCQFGAPVKTLIQSLALEENSKTKSSKLGAVDLSTVINLFNDQEYVLWCRTFPSQWYRDRASRIKVVVSLKKGITAEGQLKAWFHALLLTWRIDKERHPADLEEILEHVSITLEQAIDFDRHATRLKAAGWDLSIPVLEACSGTRIVCEMASNLPRLDFDDSSDDAPDELHFRPSSPSQRPSISHLRIASKCDSLLDCVPISPKWKCG